MTHVLGRLHRLLLLLLAGVVACSTEARLQAHAGHSHGPEITAPVAADVPPRFYGQSEAVEAILTFPPIGQAGDAVLYVASVANNAPVAGATVTADILSGSEAKLSVGEGPTSGSYVLHGLGQPETTTSLSLEIMKDDLLEILSIDNVIIAKENPAAPESGSLSGGLQGAVIFGLPGYLVLALIAMNAVVAIVVLIAFLIWVGKMIASRRRHRRTAQTAALARGTTVITFGTALMMFSAGLTQGHAGDDHSGAALVSPGEAGEGSLHFVPVDVQFEGDVRTTQVVSTTLPKSFRALGQVEIRPDRRAVVTPPVEGRLLGAQQHALRVPVQGEKVMQGDVLLVVEQIIPATEKVTLTTERAQVESELAEARQNLELATTNKARAERLAKVISAREVDEAQANFRIAQDRVSGLESRLQTLTSALSGGAASTVRQVPVIAPISGTVSMSHAVLGEYVRTDKTLFEIVNTEEVFVGADVFETDLSLLQNVQSARITVEAYGSESFSGALHSIGQEINRDTRSAHVLFAVKNPDQRLRGGMFANIEIQSGTSRNAMVVPKGAVISDGGVRQVFKKVAPEVFQAQVVTVSEFREDIAVVTGGVKTGDRVAVSGLYQVRMSPALAASGSGTMAAASRGSRE